MRYVLVLLLLAGCVSDPGYRETGPSTSEIYRNLMNTFAQPVQRSPGMNCTTQHYGDTSYTNCY